MDLDLDHHRTRSAITLGVLLLLFVLGVSWAWSSVTEPFPDPPEPSPCDDLTVEEGDRVRPPDVLVSVLNGGERAGLARETMDDLIRHGFGEGELDNTAPLRGATVQVWSGEPDSPAVRLVLSYLGEGAEVVDQPTTTPGITIAVGREFPGVVEGRGAVVARSDSYVCSPPAPVE